MDDMTTFERRVADEMLRRAGPSLPVDNLAITDIATSTTQAPRWTFQSMFGATKFVVAGAIVALFGGFLLSGVLTQQGDESLPAVGATASASRAADPTSKGTAAPEALVSDDLLPGVALVTREVEPGVLGSRADPDCVRQ